MKGQRKFSKYLMQSYIRYASLLMIILFAILFFIESFDFRLSVSGLNQESNATIVDFIKDQDKLYRNQIQNIAVSPAVKNVLAHPQDKTPAYRELYAFANAPTLKSIFYLFDANGDLLLTNLYQPNQIICQQNQKLKAMLANAIQNPDITLCGPSRIQYNYGQETAYCYYKAVLDEGKVKGFLCYDISTQSLDNILHKEKVDIVVLTDQFDNTIYCSDNSLVNSMGKSLLDWKDTDTVLNNGKPYYATSNLLTSYNVKVITLTSTLAQSHFFKLGELFLVLLLAFMILLIFILGQRTARNSLQPINVLLNAIQQFLGGNLEYRIKERTFDEFQILFDGFNQMMVKLQALLKNNSELLERKRLMEVKQLEKQFNPHFVYNVLETLKYEILINQKQASQMVVTFANLMRYSINYGNGKVSLGTDIKYVQDYLLLQKMRFSDRLSYSLHVDESLLNCQIPKLLIQPIVENCLSHGIEDEKALNIQIQVKEDAGNINFIVTDNGCGIQPERLASLKKLFETEDAMPEHIGLYDVEREVKLLYGNGYGLDIASEFGNGTRVCLTIPYEARPDNV